MRLREIPKSLKGWANLSYRGTRLQVDTHRYDGVWFLYSFSTPENKRGRGHAGKLLDTVLRRADKKGQIVKLRAEPFDTSSENALKYEDLVAFYRRHGFIFFGQKSNLGIYFPKA